jgi:CubicO group peptidase (beta-lactamase class C family)
VELHRLSEQEVARFEIPALVVGTLADGVTSVRAYGEAEEDSRFRIASITKPFTATLAALLAEQGKLDLDEPVLDGGITLAHALSHSGGLGCELPGEGLERFGSGDGALAAVAETLDEVPRHAAPGELWGYSNAGYWLAGAVSARAADEAFEDALARLVLRPLGLESSGFEPGGVLTSYDPYAEPPASYPRGRHPSGGLISTVPDLLRFAAWHLGDRPVARAMQEPRIDAPLGRWGLGWELNRPVVEHRGSWGGFRTRLALVPDRGVAVAVLASSARADGAVDRLAWAALRELAGVERRLPAAVDVTPAALDAVAGRYDLDGEPVDVSVRDGELAVESPPYPPFTGRPIAEKAFLAVEDEVGTHAVDFPRPGLARFWAFATREEAGA